MLSGYSFITFSYCHLRLVRLNWTQISSLRFPSMCTCVGHDTISFTRPTRWSHLQHFLFKFVMSVPYLLPKLMRWGLIEVMCWRNFSVLFILKTWTLKENLHSSNMMGSLKSWAMQQNQRYHQRCFFFYPNILPPSHSLVATLPTIPHDFGVLCWQWQM